MSDEVQPAKIEETHTLSTDGEGAAKLETDTTAEPAEGEGSGDGAEGGSGDDGGSGDGGGDGGE